MRKLIVPYSSILDSEHGEDSRASSAFPFSCLTLFPYSFLCGSSSTFLRLQSSEKLTNSFRTYISNPPSLHPTQNSTEQGQIKMADRVKELTKQMDDVRMSSPVKKRPHLPLTEARPLRVKGEPRLDVKKISIVVNHYPVSSN
ncbi:hypothetical protein Fcan01_12694 [Folsomia candida]|uniref:Uncharacterized protein n=1 Tax=Folsomia candida TaxID=158441 RepID=A0A226E738_FOLCA|nr:hypothetical protein Fcan01_12694 [Folsomia candida]